MFERLRAATIAGRIPGTTRSGNTIKRHPTTPQTKRACIYLTIKTKKTKPKNCKKLSKIVPILAIFLSYFSPKHDSYQQKCTQLLSEICLSRRGFFNTNLSQ